MVVAALQHEPYGTALGIDGIDAVADPGARRPRASSAASIWAERPEKLVHVE